MALQSEPCFAAKKLLVQMMSIGFIKLHRKLTEWEWYSDVNVCRVFLHLLLTANFENKKWRGVEISRGQVITSLEKLGKSTTLSIQQVRTALTKLKSTHEITIKATKLHTFITLTNYSLYQDKIIESNTPDNTQDNISATNEQQTSNKRATITKERKEVKEGKEIEEDKNSMFELFWKSYNPIHTLKGSKKDAKKSFLKALTKSSFEEIQQGLKDYMTDCHSKGSYTKQVVVWLNKECWQDDYKSPIVKTKVLTEDELLRQKQLEYYTNKERNDNNL